MIPNIHIHEQLMFERHRERQHEMAYHRKVKEALRQRPGIARRLVASVETLFLALKIRQRRVQSSESKVAYEHSRV